MASPTYSVPGKVRLAGEMASEFFIAADVSPGMLVRLSRIRRGLRQRDLAQKAGVTQAEVLAIISLQDQVQKIREERGKVQEKLRRMTKVYLDGLFPDDEYHRQKRLLEMELEGLVVPEANAAEEAGRLVQDLPNLWAGANLTERHKLLQSMLDAVYVDAKDEKRIVAVKPKPVFRPVFQVATTKEGSGVELLTSEPPESPPEARPCFWWRRGRVELPVQKNLPRTCYRLS